MATSGVQRCSSSSLRLKPLIQVSRLRALNRKAHFTSGHRRFQAGVNVEGSCAQSKSSSYLLCWDFGVPCDCSQSCTPSCKCREASYASCCGVALRPWSGTTERDGLRWSPCEENLTEYNDDCLGGPAGVIACTNYSPRFRCSWVRFLPT